MTNPNIFASNFTPRNPIQNDICQFRSLSMLWMTLQTKHSFMVIGLAMFWRDLCMICSCGTNLIKHLFLSIQLSRRLLHVFFLNEYLNGFLIRIQHSHRKNIFRGNSNKQFLRELDIQTGVDYLILVVKIYKIIGNQDEV